ncbi:MAG: DUF485 domain-containing protein [Chthoniobacterales bacterium]
MAADSPNLPEDPTPVIGSPTDVAKAAHERSGADERAAADWNRLAASESFRALLKAKRRFIVPAVVFFVIYYFALPVLVGYAQPLMTKRVIGPVNLAYLFALSQFIMAWGVAAFYVRAAARFDRMARDVIAGERP